jgi:hypothetical protein
MVAAALSEISWVAIDPGDSRLSPAHIESVIRSRATALGITIKWLATNPLATGDARYGFLIAADYDLVALKAQVLTELQSETSPFEDELIAAIAGKEQGRLISFPSDINVFTKHTPLEITSRSAIEQVVAVGEELPADAVIETYGYVRPVLYEGKITLFVERQYNGEFAPIEKANPHECCGGAHAPY